MSDVCPSKPPTHMINTKIYNHPTQLSLVDIIPRNNHLAMNTPAGRILVIAGRGLTIHLPSITYYSHVMKQDNREYNWRKNISPTNSS